MSIALTYSPAQIIRKLLIDKGLGVAAAYTGNTYSGGNWPVFDAGEPDKPDSCITVYDTQGEDHGRIMVDGEAFYYPGFQIRVRGATTVIGRTKAELIRKALAESVSLTGVTVETTHYLIYCITKIGQVMALGLEAPQTKRSLFTINALLTIRQLP